MPVKYKKNKTKPRGVSNRNRGLNWIRENAVEGVIFFADDDNSYDVSIFEQVSSNCGNTKSANESYGIFHCRCGTPR